MAQVQMQQLRKAYGSFEVLRSIDLSISDGEFVVFVGPSGCGKSTMLRCIAGLEEISSGNLYIGDQLVNDVPPSKRSIAMVFQSYALYPHMTVAKNMAFGLRLAGMRQAEIDQAVQRAAQVLKIEHLLERKPKDLSGGQRQRVAIGRAIVRKPGVFLFDEPLSNLDAALRVQMRVELSRLHKELATTMIYVTHDQVEAMTLANRIVVFNEGLIEQVGTPLELYKSPANIFVAGFIGSPKMNFLPARRSLQDSTRYDQLALADGTIITNSRLNLKARGVDESLTVGIRPEHLEISTDGCPNGLPVEVIAVEHLGDMTYLYVQGGGVENLVVRSGAEDTLQVGARIHLYLPQAHIHVFGADGQVICP
jgi:multiple sugar transport system ATP-binding protein